MNSITYRIKLFFNNLSRTLKYKIQGLLWIVFVLLLVPCGQTVADIEFDKATSSAGMTYTGETFGASWGDVNNDGFPDLFANHHRNMNTLYRNSGKGVFTDIGGQIATWVTGPHKDVHGGAWGDFDNDGDQDLMVSTGRGSNTQFFVNITGQLTDQTKQYNLIYSSIAGRLPIWFDYNNDGLLDFLIGRFNGKTPLFKQTGTGFTDVTTATGLNCNKTTYGQLIDLNNDGRMELICATQGKFPYAAYNLSNIPFKNITTTLPSVPDVIDSVIADFDGDLRQDIFLLRGDVRSSDVAMDGQAKIEAALVDHTKGFTFVSTGQLKVDIDWSRIDGGNNLNRIKIGSSGRSPTTVPFTLNAADAAVQGLPTHNATLDPAIHIGYNAASNTWTFTHYAGKVFSNPYFLLSSTTSISKLNALGFTYNDGPLSPVLFMSYGSASINRTVAAGLSAPISCISAAAADFDNDMDMDLYIACRSGALNLSNQLYENRGNGVFDRVSGAGAAPGPVGTAVGSGAGTSDSVVVADYDIDGFPDLFVSNGLNMRPIYIGGPDLLFHNRGNLNHWIELDLVGTTSNRDAIGARVIATAGGVSQRRDQNGGYHRWSQNHTRLHFGMAANTQTALLVEWPSGRTDRYNNVAVDRLYRVTEGGGITAVDGGT